MTRDQTHKEILLVALGGNALIRKGQVGTVEEQFINLRPPVSQIAELSGVTIQEKGEGTQKQSQRSKLSPKTLNQPMR
jgi:carbamate kinase